MGAIYLFQVQIEILLHTEIDKWMNAFIENRVEKHYINTCNKIPQEKKN